MKRIITAVFVAGFVPVWGPLAAQDEVSEKDIKTALASPDSTLRANTWKKLNAEKDTHYRYLVTILKTFAWYDRQAAAEALSKAATDATLKKMVRDLKDNKDPAVRMGMADALAKMNDDKVYAHLYEALKDKDPVVRRMVVHYLRIHKKKEAVQALVDLFQKEKDHVVRGFIVTSLEELTQAYHGHDPIAWFTWWEQAKADKSYELGKTDEQAKAKAEELGNKLKKRTTTTDSVTRLDAEEIGSSKLTSVPILILPEYGVSKEVMKPFLTQLSRTNKLFFIDLPPINDFKNLETVSDAKIPYYPIDKLVDAFEALRKQTEQERFAIMACGMNSWIAMRYVNLYPKSVSHLILISPISSREAYANATKRMESEGQAKNDVELWHLGMTRKFNSQTGESVHDEYHKEKKIPEPEGEDGALDRRNWSLFFKDERDSLIAMLYPKSHRPLGAVAIPDYRCFKEPPKARVPTIVITGRNSMFSTVDDCKAIAKHYGGVCYVYESSSCMPFAEESELFNKHMAVVAREKGTKTKAKGKGKDGGSGQDAKDKGGEDEAPEAKADSKKGTKTKKK